MIPAAEEYVRYWTAGGPLLWPIALVCAGIWAQFLRLRAGLTRVAREGEPVEFWLSRRGRESHGARSDEAPGQAPAPDGVLAGIVRDSLSDTESGASASDAFDARAGVWVEALTRDMVVLGALTAAAPLLGLLGTVVGMIETFDAVSHLSGETGGRVADGISQALITTQAGLVVAIPGVFGLARLQRAAAEVRARWDRCRSYLALAADRAAGPAAAAAATTEGATP